jgi:hypothetical protein
MMAVDDQQFQIQKLCGLKPLFPRENRTPSRIVNWLK